MARTARNLCIAAALLIPGTALAATVSISKPTQGDTVVSPVAVEVSTSQDFAVGKDGAVELWVDGARIETLKGTTGTVQLAPGNHQLQARLVGNDGHPLRVPANSAQVTVTVPTIDPRAP